MSFKNRFPFRTGGGTVSAVLPADVGTFRGEFDSTVTYRAGQTASDSGGIFEADQGAAPSATRPLGALGSGPNQWRWVSGDVLVSAMPIASAFAPRQLTIENGRSYELLNLADGSFIYAEKIGPGGNIVPNDAALATFSGGTTDGATFGDYTLVIHGAARHLNRRAASVSQSANYIVGNGEPTAAQGVDGDYYRQLNTAPGAFRVWGPKAGGAWPTAPTSEITPEPGNAQTYVIERTDNSTAAPTAAELAAAAAVASLSATPREGDVANVLLLDGRSIWWGYVASAWSRTRIDPAPADTGSYIGTAATYAALPASAANGKAALVGDWALLTADDIGTGTAQSPRYPRGGYVRNATGTYVLQWRLGADAVTGDYIGSAATFAALPTTSPTKTAANGDWVALTADDVGTGTAAAPQYPHGIYVSNGTAYSFAFALDTDVNLTATQANDGIDTTLGRVSGQLLRGVTDTHVRGLFMGEAATYATLPTVNAGRVAALAGDWAVLTADDIGTGTAVAPQYPRGLYRTNGTVYALSMATTAVTDHGLFLGTAGTYAALPQANAGRTIPRADDWVFLSADNIGTGTDTAPQYPRGAYRWDGASYALSMSLPALPVLSGFYIGTANTFIGLPVTNGSRSAVAGDWALLSADDIGTGTVGVPQYQRGGYRYNGTAYTFVWPLDATPNVTGDYMGLSATYVGLPISNPTKNVANGDWAALTADVVGTGTALAPQYPRGVYLHNGTSYSFAFTLGNALAPLTTVQVTNRADVTMGSVSGQRLAEAIDIHTRGFFMGAAATFAALPQANSGRPTVLTDDWAVLTADEIGTGTALAPQYPRGAYRWNGTAYALSFALSAGLPARGLFIGASGAFATLPVSNSIRPAVQVDDWALLTLDEVGTGSIPAPQYPRGVYRYDGTAYVLVMAIPLVSNFGGYYIGTATTFLALPLTNGARAAVSGDWALLSVDDIGTGTAAAPQYPRGGYRYNGTAYAFAWPLGTPVTVTGQYIGSSATFTALPTNSPTKAAANGDWAALTANDVGTGTVAVPQYPSGVYLHNGTGYSFAFALGAGAGGQLTAVQATTRTDTTFGSVSGDLIAQAITAQARGFFMGAATTFAALPVLNTGRPAVQADDWALLTVDDVGTGTAAAPQYLRGVYRWDGTAYALSMAIPLTSNFGGYYIGTAATFLTLPLTNGARAAVAGDWALLSADDISGGTAAAPQFPRGGYRFNGTAYAFAWPLGVAGGVAGVYIGSSATFAALPTTNPTKTATNGDWAALTADNIGTGTAALPQYPRGVYLHDGTSYAFAFALGGGGTATAHPGVFVGQGATFAALPTVRLDGSVLQSGDWTCLSADDIGTGTAAAPQYPRGLYRWAGATYVLLCALGGGGVALTQAQAINGIDTTEGLVTGQRLRDVTDTHVRGVYMGTAVTFAALPTTNPGRVTALDGDWAVLATDDIGTGTAAAPQYPRGGYRTNGTVYTLAWRLDQTTANVTGDFIGTGTTFATLPTTNPTKTAANGDWAVLRFAEVGAGTPGNPQFPAGIYVHNGTIYTFVAAMGSAQVGGVYMGSSATLAALPVMTTTRLAIMTGDWAVLTADDTTNLRGIYRWDGSAYVLALSIPRGPAVALRADAAALGAWAATAQAGDFAQRLDDGTWHIVRVTGGTMPIAPSQVIYHTGTPANPGNPLEPAIAINTTSNTASHRWNVTTTTWVPLALQGGTYLGTAGTFATLPTTSPSGKAGIADDWAVLSSDTIGTGTAASPQYLRGIYRFSGVSFALIAEFDRPIVQSGRYLGRGATFAGLPLNNGMVTRVTGDWVVLSANDIGTGTAAAPQFPRGIYTFDGTTYALSTPLAQMVPPAQQNLLAYSNSASLATNAARAHPAGGTFASQVRAGNPCMMWTSAITGAAIQTALGTTGATINLSGIGVPNTAIADTATLAAGIYIFTLGGGNIVWVDPVQTATNGTAGTVALTVGGTIGTQQINGAATYNYRLGDVVEVTIGPPNPLAALTSATVPGGTIEILNARSGRIRLSGVTAAGQITANSNWVVRQLSGNAAVTPTQLETNQPSGVQITVPAGQIMTGLTCTNATVSGISTNGLATITPNNAGDMVFTATFLAAPTTRAAAVHQTANAGTWITIGSIQLQVPTAGNRSLQIRSAAGTINVQYNTWLGWNDARDGMTTLNGLTTSSATNLHTYNFTVQGQMQFAHIRDTTNNRQYEVKLQIGASYNNNTFMLHEVT